MEKWKAESNFIDSQVLSSEAFFTISIADNVTIGINFSFTDLILR
jgi:hypothetical protein